jgi:short-subunit dehydrogenase
MGLLESRPLAGRVVLLTGASRGLGAALAPALAAEGCHLCLVARSATGLTHTQAACAAAAGARAVRIITVVADVTDAAECERLLQQCTTVLGDVDILCNNGTHERARSSAARKPQHTLTQAALAAASPQLRWAPPRSPSARRPRRA